MYADEKYQKVMDAAPRREYCKVCHKTTKQYLSITSHGKFLTCDVCGHVKKVDAMG